MRTDKHKLLTVAYTDTVATCATAHVLIWRCRESLVGAIPYFLSYLTQRARETNTLEARDRQLGRQRRPSPRRRASSRVRRWSPPPGQASTPLSCRMTAARNETRLPAPPPLPPPPSARPPPLSRARSLRPAVGRSSRLSSPARPPWPGRKRSLSPPRTMPPPPAPAPPTLTPAPPEALRPRHPPYRLPALPVAASLPSPPSPLAIPLQVHALRCLPRTQSLPSHIPTPSPPPHRLPPPTRLPTSTAPPHRAYSTRRRRPTCARPTPPLPYRTSLRNRRLSTRIFTAQHYHSTDTSPALPAAHLSAQ